MIEGDITGFPAITYGGENLQFNRRARRIREESGISRRHTYPPQYPQGITRQTQGVKAAAV